MGGTLAYFNSRHTNVTSLTTKVYSTQATQEYTSPENFLPGTLANMNTKVINTREVEVAVRAKIEESWTSHNNASIPLINSCSPDYVYIQATDLIQPTLYYSHPHCLNQQ